MAKSDNVIELNEKIIKDLQKYFDIPNLKDMTITERVELTLSANERPRIAIINVPREK